MAALREENAVLQTTLTSLRQLSGSDNNSKANRNEWLRAPSRRKRRPQRPRDGPSQQASTGRRTSTTSPAMESSTAALSDSIHQPATRNRSLVPGARKIWGTHPSATTRAVSKTISSLTKVPTDNIIIKRKYKTNQQSSGGQKLSRWWFVIRGNEDTMKQLEEKWNQVSMQLDWKLEPLYSFSEPGSIPESELQLPSNPKLTASPELHPSNTPEPHED